MDQDESEHSREASHNFEGYVVRRTLKTMNEEPSTSDLMGRLMKEWASSPGEEESVDQDKERRKIFQGAHTEVGGTKAETHETYVNFRGTCALCFLPVCRTKRVVCANVSTGRGTFSPCNNAWHRRCYRIMPGDMFPIDQPQD